eukprot:TRINITY_DN26708_c0_g2_i1.p1 TRINITY_DN26708_c0_g2~~TRINITY_DN26708_c0_g2_i1.p1  ORF type:complete len:542 (-),score=70.85 TRINITY_DN26708_c0_g2_i1:4-1581(-)
MAPSSDVAAGGWGREERLTGIGRRVIADIDLKPGDLVLRETPWAAVLLSPGNDMRCDWCFEAGDNLLRCPTTGLRFQSQKQQQRANSEYYACECRASKALATRGKAMGDLSPALRLAARALWRASSRKDADGAIPWMGLEDHWFSLAEARRAELKAMGQGCSGIVGCGLPKEAPAADPLVLARLLAIIAVNAISITDEELRDVGLGLYLAASAFNHGEEPNCTHSFEGRELVIRAKQPIRKGQELTITYSELAEHSRFRRAFLREKYFFDPLTQGNHLPESTVRRDVRLQEILHRASSGWRSMDCGVAWCQSVGVVTDNTDDDTDAVSRWISDLHDSWSAVNSMDEGPERLSRLKQLCQRACADDSAAFRLGPGHALLLSIVRAAMDAAVASEAWSDAAKFGRMVVACERSLYPEPWPVVAISLARLAKLELYMGDFAAACTASREALKTFSALGYDTKLCEELRQLLATAEAETRCYVQSQTQERQQKLCDKALTDCAVDHRPKGTATSGIALAVPQVDLGALD